MAPSQKVLAGIAGILLVLALFQSVAAGEPAQRTGPAAGMPAGMTALSPAPGANLTLPQGDGSLPGSPISGDHVPDTLIVRFAAAVDDQASRETIRLAHLRTGSIGAEDLGGSVIPGLQVVRLPAGTDLAFAIAAYQSTPGVLYAEPDYRISVITNRAGPVSGEIGLSSSLALPGDALFSEQWALNNTGQFSGTPDADIDATEAWDIATGSGTVIVAVADTGVMHDHADLAPNIWTNAGEVPGNGKDDDHNGYIDDVHGWDFVHNDNTPGDDYDHGTFCAGIIGAAGDNGIGIAGVNWHVAIMPLKIADEDGKGNTSDAIRAFGYARANGALIVSNSWGGDNYSQALRDAIEASPALMVFAAGNDGTNNDLTPLYPASYPSTNILAVAATDNRDNLAGFSCYGQESVDIAAPGVFILSTRHFQDSYLSQSGTSAAAPHAAGVAALLKSINSSLSTADIKRILMENVDAKTSLAGKVATGGRLNAYRAVKNAVRPMAIQVTSITPRTSANTSTVSITDLSGTNFRAGAKVQLNRTGITGPVHAGKITDATGGAVMTRPNGITVSGRYAYLPGLFSDSLEIVDVANPSVPAHVGKILNGASGALLSYPYAVAVSGNYAFVASYGSNALEIINVTNPAGPAHEGSITDGTGGALLNAPEAVFVAGNYAYVASYGSNALEIVDVTDKAHPVHAGSIVHGDNGALLSGPQGVFVAGNYAYVASYGSNALEIVDVTDKAHPVHAGSIADGPGPVFLNGPVNVFVAGNTAYVASYLDNALEIVDVADKAHPVHKGSIAHGEGGALLAGPRGVSVAGNFAWVASSGSNAVEVVDVADPAHPVHQGSIAHGDGGALLDWPAGIAATGSFVFVASWNSDALEVLDPGFIPATGVDVVSPLRITCLFDLAGKPAGMYNVVVSMPAGQADDPPSWSRGMLVNGFTILGQNPVIPLPGYTNPPTDPDGDGVHEDLNANGRLDFADVVLFFSQMSWIAANEPVEAFDLNRNGRIDFADIVALFGEV